MASRTQNKILRDGSSHDSIDHTLPPPLTSRVQSFPCRRLHQRSAHPRRTQSRSPMSNFEPGHSSSATSARPDFLDDALPAASSSASALDEPAAEPPQSQDATAPTLGLDTEETRAEAGFGQANDPETVEVTSLVSPDADPSPAASQPASINQEGHSPSDDVTVGLRPPDSIEDLALTTSQSPLHDNELTVLKDDAALEQALPQTTRTTSPPPTGPDLLSTYTCPICFCPPTNASLVLCGHVFCGSCLFTAVKSTLKRGMEPGGIARCPVCRSPIVGWDGVGAGVIGLKPQAVVTL